MNGVQHTIMNVVHSRMVCYKPPMSNESKLRKGGRRPAAETQERILELTTDLMAAEGLSAIKARTIAAQAGVSVGTIYNMFGDLDDLVRLANGRTYDDLYAHQRDALSQTRGAGHTPTEQLYALAHAYLEWVTQHHLLWSATLAFNRERMDTAPDWYREKETALLGIIEDALDDFPVTFQGQMRLHTARALWASIHGIVGMAMGTKTLLLPEAEIDMQMWIVIRAVAGALEDGS